MLTENEQLYASSDSGIEVVQELYLGDATEMDVGADVAVTARTWSCWDKFRQLSSFIGKNVSCELKEDGVQ